MIEEDTFEYLRVVYIARIRIDSSHGEGKNN